MQRLVRQLHAKTVDKEPKEVKKLNKIKFAVEAMEIEPNDAKSKNEPKDAKFGNVKNESKDAKLRWMHTVDGIQQNGREWRMDKLWTRRDHYTVRCGRGWNFAA